MTALTPTHKRVLAEIGWGGIEPERLTRNGREFDELKRDGLIVFWPIRGERPGLAYGRAVTPGRWYLTAAGAAVIGLDNHPLLFLEDAQLSR